MECKFLLPVIMLAWVWGCSTHVSENYESQPTASRSVISGNQTVEVNNDSPSIKAELSDGLGIAALLNKNYNENTSRCVNYISGIESGHYWCTGVLVRTTDNGNFPPWEPSPTALRLGGTSFAWIRHDEGTKTLYKRAGFAVLNPADLIAGAVQGMSFELDRVFCFYPFDAYTTRTMTRKSPGCDFENTAPGVNAFGTCDYSLGYTTAAQWNAHFRSVGQTNYRQCSWSAWKSSNWVSAIQSRKAFVGQSSWSEVMMWNAGDTNDPRQIADNKEAVRKSIVGFFFDPSKSGSLADAQAFQKKLADTGRRVPVLRLNFQAPASQRFVFSQGDQLTGYYP